MYFQSLSCGHEVWVATDKVESCKWDSIVGGLAPLCWRSFSVKPLFICIESRVEVEAVQASDVDASWKSNSGGIPGTSTLRGSSSRGTCCCYYSTYSIRLVKTSNSLDRDWSGRLLQSALQVNHRCSVSWYPLTSVSRPHWLAYPCPGLINSRVSSLGSVNAAGEELVPKEFMHSSDTDDATSLMEYCAKMMQKEKGLL